MKQIPFFSIGLPTLLFLAIDPSPFSDVQKRHTAQW